MLFRPATIADIPALQIIRTSVQENVLSDPTRITAEDYETYIRTKGAGWVGEVNGKPVGFAIVDLADHNVWALFVLPGFQSQGIGQQLHDHMLHWYFQQTDTTLWLSTDPGTRAEAFYRKNHWKETGTHHNEIRFEMTAAQWRTRPTVE